MSYKSHFPLQNWQHRIFILSAFIFICWTLTSCTLQESNPSKLKQALLFIDQGTQYYREERLDEAEAAFLLAKDLANPASALDGLGCVALKRGDLVLAESLFVQAYQLDSSYINAISNLATLYNMAGLEKIATRLYHWSLSENPDNYITRNNYAALLHAQNELNAAKKELYKAFTLAKAPQISANLIKLNKYEQNK